MLNSNLIIFKIGDTLIIKLPFDLQISLILIGQEYTQDFVLVQESKSRAESWWRKKLELSAIIKLRKLEPTTL